MSGDLEIGGLQLVMTCGACPEQYDVFFYGAQVGYLRLRHGYFRAEFGDVGGPVVYQAHPKGDGIFEDGEREYYLSEAVAAIKEHMIRSLT